MDKLHLTIVTPLGKIFDGSVEMVTLPGSEGEFGVLPGHADTVSTLVPGAIELFNGGTSEVVAVDWGYAKVNETSVDVLADGAVYIRGISESELASAISDAKDMLENAKDSNVVLSSVMAKIEQAGKKYL
jgi:F-type H+-transporting ATPase subunit epsilon